MPKFRKKPVVIEATQWWPGDEVEGVVIAQPRPVPSRGGGIAFTLPERPVVETLEGEMQVTPGDWIVTGVAGERYPVKDSIFRETYEPAS